MSAHSKPKLSPELKEILAGLTFDQQRVAIGIFLNSGSGHSLWDLITGLRGPDSPSEKPNMTQTESSMAYKGRRDRKFKSTEVIRQAAFFGVVGGSARRHTGTSILLPPQEEWDHFDKHMYRAANAIGLEVKYEK